MKSFKERLQSVNSDTFDELAMELFHFQADNNSLYKHYIKELGIVSGNINTLDQIPFLPITFFKNHRVTTGKWKEQLIFESSGTTGINSSRHFIRDELFYKQVSGAIFKRFYGDPRKYVILALLPSYLERGRSSLIYMVDHLIQLTESPESGFYLYNYKDILKKTEELKGNKDREIMIWGVTFALLELAEKYPVDLKNAVIIETGGMKGRRRELVREEVHKILKDAFNLDAIHSEYGMTELMSQAYSKQKGQFFTPPWMRIYIREINDPFCLDNSLKQGGINIIDLANINSCAFIATEDLGKINKNNSFEVLGRIDNSDIRGCNLLLN